MVYLKQNAGCTSWCTRWAPRPHAEKLLSASLSTSCLAEIWKILCLDPSLLCASFTAAVPSTVIRRCVITFNSCKTVSTSNMALETVSIDKIIKVTSASSYVLFYDILSSSACLRTACCQYSSTVECLSFKCTDCWLADVQLYDWL